MNLLSDLGHGPETSSPFSKPFRYVAFRIEDEATHVFICSRGALPPGYDLLGEKNERWSIYNHQANNKLLMS